MRKPSAFLLALAIAGCATSESFKESRSLVESGHEVEGLERMARELEENPRDTELRNYYLRHRAVAVQRFLALGDRARSAGALERAQEEYERALRLEPENAQAKEGLKQIQLDKANATLLAE